ncbi:hypothetical protein KI387_043803 [Taxus chinensis]|uniref:DUF1677 family protein n=1 Tax=Taxus chinensis TaxID=29808 RepID=A0AA38KM41_TAXCH|nr:hypothetical protein KI387_043803 [Taxus chinensis]
MYLLIYICSKPKFRIRALEVGIDFLKGKVRESCKAPFPVPTLLETSKLEVTGHASSPTSRERSISDLVKAEALIFYVISFCVRREHKETTATYMLEICLKVLDFVQRKKGGLPTLTTTVQNKTASLSPSTNKKMAPSANSNVNVAENKANLYGVTGLSKKVEGCSRPRRMSNEYKIQRAVSDGAALITSSHDDDDEQITSCDCCGLSEECTGAYVRKVRELFCGRWICGLCSEAVKEEAQRSVKSMEEALQAHIYVHSCTRTNPALNVAHALRHLLKKKNIPTATNTHRLPRTTSCIPSIK